jgi:hypothetical protein
MRREIATWVAGLTAVAVPGSALAHHSGAMYEVTPIWVEGTVVEFRNISPHSVTIVEETGADGEVRRWGIEGPSRSQLSRERADATLPQVGDKLKVCGFPYKSAEELSRMYPGVDFATRRASSGDVADSPTFVAGHVIVRADGARQLWEPHGLIAECIQSSADGTEPWLELINSSAKAREAWCAQRHYAHIQSSASLRDVVEQIDGAIERPCR